MSLSVQPPILPLTWPEFFVPVTLHMTGTFVVDTEATNSLGTGQAVGIDVNLSGLTPVLPPSWDAHYSTILFSYWPVRQFLAVTDAGNDGFDRISYLLAMAFHSFRWFRSRSTRSLRGLSVRSL